MRIWVWGDTTWQWNPGGATLFFNSLQCWGGRVANSVLQFITIMHVGMGRKSREAYLFSQSQERKDDKTAAFSLPPPSKSFFFFFFFFSIYVT